MNESILISIKKLLGLGAEYTDFDQDILIHINTAIANLVQIGVGPSEGFYVYGNSETWEDFVGENPKLSQIKSDVYLRVKLLFDPPSSATLLESTNRMIAELEWRLYVEKGGY